MTNDKPQQPQNQAEQGADGAMPFMAHMAELRSRLLWVVAAIFAGFAVCYAFKEALFQLLMLPLTTSENAPSSMITTGVPELFFVYVKMAFLGGLFLAFPLLIWHLWRFAAPGLYAAERRVAAPLMLLTPLLFYVGGAFMYFFVMPLAVTFFLSFQTPDIQALPSVREYLSFIIKMFFAFGLAFELPVLLLLLAKSGAVQLASLQKGRRYAIVAAFVVAAVLTPPDPLSQVLLAVPLMVLYELSLLLIRLFVAPKKEADAL